MQLEGWVLPYLKTGDTTGFAWLVHTASRGVTSVGREPWGLAVRALLLALPPLYAGELLKSPPVTALGVFRPRTMCCSLLLEHDQYSTALVCGPLSFRKVTQQKLSPWQLQLVEAL